MSKRSGPFAAAEACVCEAPCVVFTVNGNLVRDRHHTLSEGDELTLLPPVGGR